MKSDVVLTIGHSTHPISTFIQLLRSHRITAVADVRSTPYSRHQSQYNRPVLQQALKDEGIAYVFLGKELGGRSDDPSCYENGRVQYRRVGQSSLFQSGLDRLIEGARTHRVAMLCAEKDPLNCHRTILVARELERRGVPVAHIHADGRLEAQDEAMQRLRAALKLPEADLFRGAEELTEEACARQEVRIAYVDRGEKFARAKRSR